MIKTFLALTTTCLLSFQAQASEIRNTIRDTGAAFEGVKKITSPECGEVNCSLNDNDNCSLTFDNFYADSEDSPRKACTVRLEVDLPEGWSMAPNAVTIEGDYQISEEGFNWIETSFGLANGESVRFNNYQNPFIADDEALSSDAFLLTREINTKTFSPCGGVAVFEGDIILNAVKGRNDKYVSEINVTQQNNGKAYGAEWGWVYKKCGPTKYWFEKGFKAAYTDHWGKKNHGHLNFNRRSGTFTPYGGGNPIKFSKIEIDEDGKLIKGKWNVGHSSGWFWMKSNDAYNLDRHGFSGGWGVSTNQDGQWFLN